MTNRYNPPLMFKPIRWRTFPRDFLVIQSAFLMFGFAIATMIRANLVQARFR